MLGAAFGECEDLVVDAWTVDRLTYRALRVPERNLPIVLTMNDQERNAQLRERRAEVTLGELAVGRGDVVGSHDFKHVLVKVRQACCDCANAAFNLMPVIVAIVKGAQTSHAFEPRLE